MSAPVPPEGRGPAVPVVPARERLSPRRRRLRATAIALSFVAGFGALLGGVIYVKTRPAEYRPDEASPDITSSLARQLPPEAPKPRFTDVTAAAGLGQFRNFHGDRTSQLPEDIGPGLAWGDFDNDGDDDLFLVSAGGPLGAPEGSLAPSELYENLGDGTFRKVAAFPELRGHGTGAAWGDYDGDGFLDLAVAGYNLLVLLHNEGGSGRFTRDLRLPDRPGLWSSVSWGDYDHDRAPDLYVCGYVQYVENLTDRERGSMQVGAMVPFTLNPASYPGGINALFHNNADGTFTDAAPALHVTNPEGRSLGGLWHDFDEDGWLDLYVANDISDNVLYRNTGGGFEDISHPALVADYRSAMGLAVGDYDRDGDDDLYVTHWVAQENALYDNLWADFNAPRHGAPDARGQGTNGSPRLATSMAANRYPLRFMDVADQKGVGQMALPFVGWGAEFADFDGDGWLDLVVANGSTLESEGPFPRKLKPQEAFLLWNRRGEHFFDLAPLCPPLMERHNSRGLACADFDNDGDLDVAIAQLGEGVQLLRNDMSSGHWLKLRLRSRTRRGAPVGFGDGSQVLARVGEALLRRSVTSLSYLSQSSRTLQFGLGAATRVDRLEVRWLAGGTNVHENLDADASYEITEDVGAVRKLPGRAGRLSLPAPARSALPPDAGSPARAAAGTPRDDRERLLQFWTVQRAAMDAMKVERDNAKAIGLFREAIALNPQHEDSRYYLGLCLAGQGETDGALTALAGLQQLNPQSHRAWQQWGVVRALFARTDADLASAEQALQRAHALNPEETGALLVLGEVALLRGQTRLADERLAAATRTNPRAAGGFFLRGFLAWRGGDAAAAAGFLSGARAALGKEWQPTGATSEGDVRRRQHVEITPLARFWEAWDGMTNPGPSFAALDAFVRTNAFGSSPSAATGPR